MQEQQAQNIEAGRPRVWVPGQGWVAIDPDWERQNDAPNDEDAQVSASEQNRAGPSQDGAQGYDADSETDGNELQLPSSDKADPDRPVTAGTAPKKDQEQHRDEERRESEPVQSSYTLRQGVQVSQDSGHEGEEQDIAERSQNEAEMLEREDTEETDQEKVSSKDEGREHSERQDDTESSERDQQDESPAAGQQQQTTAEPSRNSMEQAEESQERRSHWGKVKCMPIFP